MSTQEAAEPQGDQPDELTVILRKGVLQQVLDQLQTIVSEAAIRLGRDGLHVEAIDPATVAMVDIDLGPEAFEHAGEGQYYFGLDLERFDDYLSNANQGDLVEIALDTETRRLHIEHTSISVDMAAIDPEAIRSPKDLPDLGWPCEAVLPASKLQTAVDTADLASDQVEFTADADGEVLRVIGEGDMDTIETELDREDVIDAKVPETATSLFSTDYLAGSSGMLDPIPKDAETTFELGDEVPIIVAYEFAEGAGSAELLVSPRLQTQ